MDRQRRSSPRQTIPHASFCSSMPSSNPTEEHGGILTGSLHCHEPGFKSNWAGCRTGVAASVAGGGCGLFGLLPRALRRQFTVLREKIGALPVGLGGLFLV